MTPSRLSYDQMAYKELCEAIYTLWNPYSQYLRMNDHNRKVHGKAIWLPLESDATTIKDYLREEVGIVYDTFHRFRTGEVENMCSSMRMELENYVDFHVDGAFFREEFKRRKEELYREHRARLAAQAEEKERERMRKRQEEGR